MAVSGSSVCVTGSFVNTTANTQVVPFGSVGITPGTITVRGATVAISSDLLLAKYIDNGPTATLGWTQVGGGNSGDSGTSVAVGGQNVVPSASFGGTTIAAPAGGQTSIPARVVDISPTPLAVRPALASSAGPARYPTATLAGLTPDAAMQVFDVLGRLVVATTADAAGTARLSGLLAGLYLAPTGGQAARLVVE